MQLIVSILSKNYSFPISVNKGVLNACSSSLPSRDPVESGEFGINDLMSSYLWTL